MTNQTFNKYETQTEDNEIPLLEVSHLTKYFGKGCSYCFNPSFEDYPENRCPKCGTIWACRDVSFDLYEGEILGIVGESGSGKSSLVKCLYFDEEVSTGIAKLAPYKEKTVNIFEVSAQQKRYIKNHLMGMVYQNPWMGLRMNYSSSANVAEKLIAAENYHVRKIKKRSSELLDHMDIPLARIKERPKNFSGGMQQRVQIAKALANNPPLLLLDEVTTGLDLTVQAKVLDLIRNIQRELNVAMLIVSHDLAVIRMLADRTIVMKQGKIIEEGLTDQILEDPQHAYTQLLVQSLL